MGNMLYVVFYKADKQSLKLHYLKSLLIPGVEMTHQITSGEVMLLIIIY